jgi:hypothetical protein
MANTKQEVAQPFKITRPPERHTFRSITKTNPVLKAAIKNAGLKPKVFIKTSDNILWPYKADFNGQLKPLPLDDDISEIDLYEKGELQLQWLPRQIRYIYGLNTPFVDEQEAARGNELKRDPNGMSAILDNPLNRDAVLMVDDTLRIKGDDTVLFNYVWMMNQCKNQHPKARRYGNAVPTFERIDFGDLDRQRVILGKMREDAWQLATTAKVSDMLPHAARLLVEMLVPDSTDQRDIDAIRHDYKDVAYSNPKLFLDTFNDPKTKIYFAINRLVEAGKLSLGSIQAGQAHWTTPEKLITILPPDRIPVEFLGEYALTAEGEAFASQIEAYKGITKIDSLI